MFEECWFINPLLLIVLFISTTQQSDITSHGTAYSDNKALQNPEEHEMLVLSKDCEKMCDEAGCLFFCPQPSKAIKRCITRSNLSKRLCCTTDGPISSGPQLMHEPADNTHLGSRPLLGGMLGNFNAKKNSLRLLKTADAKEELRSSFNALKTLIQMRKASLSKIKNQSNLKTSTIPSNESQPLQEPDKKTVFLPEYSTSSHPSEIEENQHVTEGNIRPSNEDKLQHDKPEVLAGRTVIDDTVSPTEFFNDSENYLGLSTQRKEDENRHLIESNISLSNEGNAQRNEAELLAGKTVIDDTVSPTDSLNDSESYLDPSVQGNEDGNLHTIESSIIPSNEGNARHENPELLAGKTVTDDTVSPTEPFNDSNSYPPVPCNEDGNQHILESSIIPSSEGKDRHENQGSLASKTVIDDDVNPTEPFNDSESYRGPSVQGNEAGNQHTVESSIVPSNEGNARHENPETLAGKTVIDDDVNPTEPFNDSESYLGPSVQGNEAGNQHTVESSIVPSNEGNARHENPETLAGKTVIDDDVNPTEPFNDSESYLGPSVQGNEDGNQHILESSIIPPSEGKARHENPESLAGKTVIDDADSPTEPFKNTKSYPSVQNKEDVGESIEYVTEDQNAARSAQLIPLSSVLNEDSTNQDNSENPGNSNTLTFSEEGYHSKEKNNHGKTSVLSEMVTQEIPENKKSINADYKDEEEAALAIETTTMILQNDLSPLENDEITISSNSSNNDLESRDHNIKSDIKIYATSSDALTEFSPGGNSEVSRSAYEHKTVNPFTTEIPKLSSVQIQQSEDSTLIDGINDSLSLSEPVQVPCYAPQTRSVTEDNVKDTPISQNEMNVLFSAKKTDTAITNGPEKKIKCNKQTTSTEIETAVLENSMKENTNEDLNVLQSKITNEKVIFKNKDMGDQNYKQYVKIKLPIIVSDHSALKSQDLTPSSITLEQKHVLSDEQNDVSFKAYAQSKIPENMQTQVAEAVELQTNPTSDLIENNTTGSVQEGGIDIQEKLATLHESMEAIELPAISVENKYENLSKNNDTKVDYVAFQGLRDVPVSVDRQIAEENIDKEQKSENDVQEYNNTNRHGERNAGPKSYFNLFRLFQGDKPLTQQSESHESDYEDSSYSPESYIIFSDGNFKNHTPDSSSTNDEQSHDFSKFQINREELSKSGNGSYLEDSFQSFNPVVSMDNVQYEPFELFLPEKDYEGSTQEVTTMPPKIEYKNKPENGTLADYIKYSPFGDIFILNDENLPSGEIFKSSIKNNNDSLKEEDMKHFSLNNSMENGETIGTSLDELNQELSSGDQRRSVDIRDSSEEAAAPIDLAGHTQNNVHDNSQLEQGNIIENKNYQNIEPRVEETFELKTTPLDQSYLKKMIPNFQDKEASVPKRINVLPRTTIEYTHSVNMNDQTGTSPSENKNKNSEDSTENYEVTVNSSENSENRKYTTNETNEFVESSNLGSKLHLHKEEQKLSQGNISFQALVSLSDNKYTGNFNYISGRPNSSGNNKPDQPETSVQKNTLESNSYENLNIRRKIATSNDHNLGKLSEIEVKQQLPDGNILNGTRKERIQSDVVKHYSELLPNSQNSKNDQVQNTDSLHKGFVEELPGYPLSEDSFTSELHGTSFNPLNSYSSNIPDVISMNNLDKRSQETNYIESSNDLSNETRNNTFEYTAEHKPHVVYLQKDANQVPNNTIPHYSKGSPFLNVNSNNTNGFLTTKTLNRDEPNINFVPSSAEQTGHVIWRLRSTSDQNNDLQQLEPTVKSNFGGTTKSNSEIQSNNVISMSREPQQINTRNSEFMLSNSLIPDNMNRVQSITDIHLDNDKILSSEHNDTDSIIASDEEVGVNDIHDYISPLLKGLAKINPSESQQKNTETLRDENYGKKSFSPSNEMLFGKVGNMSESLLVENEKTTPLELGESSKRMNDILENSFSSFQKDTNRNDNYKNMTTIRKSEITGAQLYPYELDANFNSNKNTRQSNNASGESLNITYTIQTPIVQTKTENIFGNNNSSTNPPDILRNIVPEVILADISYGINAINQTDSKGYTETNESENANKMENIGHENEDSLAKSYNLQDITNTALRFSGYNGYVPEKPIDKTFKEPRSLISGTHFLKDKGNEEVAKQSKTDHANDISRIYELLGLKRPIIANTLYEKDAGLDIEENIHSRRHDREEGISESKCSCSKSKKSDSNKSDNSKESHNNILTQHPPIYIFVGGHYMIDLSGKPIISVVPGDKISIGKDVQNITARNTNINRPTYTYEFIGGQYVRVQNKDYKPESKDVINNSDGKQPDEYNIHEHTNKAEQGSTKQQSAEEREEETSAEYQPYPPYLTKDYHVKSDKPADTGIDQTEIVSENRYSSDSNSYAIENHRASSAEMSSLPQETMKSFPESQDSSVQDYEMNSSHGVQTSDSAGTSHGVDTYVSDHETARDLPISPNTDESGGNMYKEQHSSQEKSNNEENGKDYGEFYNTNHQMPQYSEHNNDGEKPVTQPTWNYRNPVANGLQYPPPTYIYVRTK